MKLKTKSHKPAKIQSVKKVQKSKNKLSKNSISIAKTDETSIKKQVPLVPAKKKSKYVMPSQGVTEDLVSKCLDALQTLTVQYQAKNKLLEDEIPIFAEIHCIKIQNTKGSIRFVLPHSTVASTGEVCLVTPDLKKGKKPDHEPTIEHWEELLKKANVTSVKTILPMRQLRVEYDQFELKRRLLTQHDFMMIDTRVLNHVSHSLGKIFLRKHNMLVPVRINEQNLQKSIDTGIRTSVLRLNIGETSTLVVGHTGMSKEYLKENVLAFVNQLQERFPGGQANIRAINLKLPLSLSLPLYITLRPSNTVGNPKIKPNVPKKSVVLEDELSTVPGKRVMIAPDGTIKLKKEQNISDVEDNKEDSDQLEEESDKEEDDDNE